MQTCFFSYLNYSDIDHCHHRKKYNQWKAITIFMCIRSSFEIVKFTLCCVANTFHIEITRDTHNAMN